MTTAASHIPRRRSSYTAARTRADHGRCRDPRCRVREGRHRLAADGAVTGLMNIGTSTRAPVVIDFGSFLLARLFLSGVSVTAFLSRRAGAATRPAVAVIQP